MEAQAKLRTVRVSARKARLVADLIRGREVGEALEILQFTRKKTAPLLKGLVESAVANAEFKANRDGDKIDIDVATGGLEEGTVTGIDIRNSVTGDVYLSLNPAELLAPPIMEPHIEH